MSFNCVEIIKANISASMEEIKSRNGYKNGNCKRKKSDDNKSVEENASEQKENTSKQKENPSKKTKTCEV